MKAIHKFKLFDLGKPLMSSVRVSSGKSFNVVHLDIQDNVITVWAEVDQEEAQDDVDRLFMVIGTGWTITPGLKHVGTVMAGPFVWHIYMA